MANLTNVFVIGDYHTIPLTSIIRSGMEAMSQGGYVKISNHTGRNPIVAYDPAYAVYEQPIPKYYIYVKDPVYNLWMEYDGWRPTEKCKKGLTTMATESNIFQRIHTRMDSPPAFRITVFDAKNNVLGAYDRKNIDLRS